MKKSQDDDKFLVERSLAGDEEAFGRLYDKYLANIYRFVVFRVSHHSEAEDLTAETFLKTWQYLSSAGKAVENFKALLYRIAANLIVDYYRERSRADAILPEAAWEKIIDQSESAEDDLTEKQDIKRVYGALEELELEQRQLLLLRYGDDLTIKEIARLTGKSPGAIRVALHRAVKAIKNILK